MSLIKDNSLAWRLHAKQSSYKKKLNTFMQSLSEINPNKSYVSFSAGKDSMVLASAANIIHPGIPICMVDPGIPTHWTKDDKDLICNYANNQGWHLLLFSWDKWCSVSDSSNEIEHRNAAHKSMFSGLEKWAIDNGRLHYLTGIRAQESVGRRKSIKIHGQKHKNKRGFIRHCPIAWWDSDDIWAYTVSQSMPWLSIYDYLGPNARNGLIGRGGEYLGRMVYLKKFYPAEYRYARDILSLEYAQ